MAILFVLCEQAYSQPPNSDGFTRLKGKHIQIVTDLPLDDNLQQLPEIFDQAIPGWCEFFEIDLESTQKWQTTLYLMLDRQRFKTAGLLPDSLPNFPHGWQQGDELWVVEQPSAYYRTHLMLHEGTHWFMFRKYGFYDTPWLTEGIAEILGTHRWSNQKLTLGVIPATRDDVPFWGRIKVIREQAADGLAPSMEEIWRYSNTAHQSVDAYAWSWAMTLFLKHHPDTAKIFSALLRQPAMNSREVDRWFRGRLSNRMPHLRAAWRAFITDLDYGFSTSINLARLSEQPKPLDNPIQLNILANQGWQASGVSVHQDSVVQIDARGEFTIANDPKPWRSTADGVTLEYYRGQPLGKLLLMVLNPQSQDLPTELTEVVAVGQQLQWRSKGSGELFFRVNEPTGQLSDNEGSITVQLGPVP